MAIIGTHLLIYTPQADEARSILADAFGFDNIDSGDGWLIFRLPSAELGVHPSEGATNHAISFMCDDMDSTIADLNAKGLRFHGPPVDMGWGIGTTAVLPGGVEVMIYEPKHPQAIES